MKVTASVKKIWHQVCAPYFLHFDLRVSSTLYEMRCAIFYLYSLKNVKSTHGGVLLLVKFY